MPGSPYNPATGERAPLGPYPPLGTTLALFQVVGDDPLDPDTADTHDNYVVCRGYEADSDPTFRYLHDPYTKPDTTPINVAKPYSVRGTFPYAQGQVIVAARIKNRLGYNAGKAATIGQPEDLSDELSLLTDANGVGIAWLDLGTTPPVPGWFGMEGTLSSQGVVTSSTPSPLANFSRDVGDPSLFGFTGGASSNGFSYGLDEPEKDFLAILTAHVTPTVPTYTVTMPTGSEAKTGMIAPINSTIETLDANRAALFSFPTTTTIGINVGPVNISHAREIHVNPGDNIKVYAAGLVGSPYSFAFFNVNLLLSPI